MDRLVVLLASLAFIVFAAFGCAVQQPQARLATFEPAEYAPFDRTGTGAINGQAFLLTKGGDVKTAAGRHVMLNPVTSLSTEGFERGVLGGQTLERADARHDAYVRSVVADGEGRFRFEGLPAGEYYITTYIEWYYSQYGKTGGIAHAKARVENGKTTEVIVTR